MTGGHQLAVAALVLGAAVIATGAVAAHLAAYGVRRVVTAQISQGRRHG